MLEHERGGEKKSINMDESSLLGILPCRQKIMGGRHHKHDPPVPSNPMSERVHGHPKLRSDQATTTIMTNEGNHRKGEQP